MQLDNTGMIGFGSTGSQIRRVANPGPMGGRRLAGLGALWDMGDVASPNTSAETAWYADPKIMTAVNSEILWLTNLARQADGKTPIPPQYAAPSVNVGLTPEAKNMLLLGAAALLGVILLSRRSR